ncbi:protein PRRC2A-like isoform X3 [Watersipora subatra]|uniref:protein PRRC2A-like isoform X3 n=1 Tax=Watersipora subatra TaxID=2589382 RepID=UPI00355C4C53
MSSSGLSGQNRSDKKKFQSININSVYKGKGAEAQKSSVQRQHGLQSLGKVAAVRRMPPPIHLPSLKSENSGNDPTVSLVPSGPASTGWGTGKTSTGSDSQQQSGQPSRQQQNSMLASGTAKSGATRSDTGPVTSGGSGVGTVSQTQPKTWSSVTGRGTTSFDQERPPPPVKGKESVRFAREFPSLEGGTASGAGGKPGTGTSLDLRPQNVGSWRDGGGKNITSDPQTGNDENRTGGVVADQRPHDSDDEDMDSYRSSSYNGRMYNQKTQNSASTEDRLFKRPTIVKDKDIEDLGHKAASQAVNEESSWANAPDDIDYSVKLVFSDDEDQASGPPSKSSGTERKPPSPNTHPSDRPRQDSSPDKSNQSTEHRSGTGYRPGGDRGRSREAWAPHPHSYSGYPPQDRMMPRNPYDMWQRGQPTGGKPAPPNMPPGGPYGYRMPYPGPGGMGRPPPALHSPTDEDEQWSRKQKNTNKEVNAALERAMSKRGEESEEQRRSRSASESSSSDQVSRSHGSNKDKRSQQVPPRFQQQRSRERSPERGGRDEGGAYYPAHPQHKQGQQPPWGMGWANPPWMGGMPMPPRPRNNSRSSDDDRRTPDQPNYKQLYEMQMTHWMHMMSEYAKANPDVPLPPVPPFVPMPPRGGPGMMPPPPESNRMIERKPSSDSHSDRDSQPPTKNTDHEPITHVKSVDKLPSDSKVQADPFEDPPVSKPSSADDTQKLSSSTSRDESKSTHRSYRGERREERDRRDDRERKDDRRHLKTDGKFSRHDGQKPPRRTKSREESDSKEGMGGGEARKRRSDMTAPPPVVKESLRGDNDRQRQMVTLRRNSKKDESKSKAPESTSTSTSVVTAHPTDKSQDKKSVKPESQAPPTESSKTSLPPPKQSAWGPTPVPQAISIGVEEAKSKSVSSQKSEQKENLPPALDETVKDERTKDERAKDSPDVDKPPVKRYKEEQSRSSHSRNGRGTFTQYPVDRGGRRGGPRSREFVRGGGSIGRGSSARGGYSVGRGARSLSGRTSRGRSGYEGRNMSRDFREGYSAEDWENERQLPVPRREMKSKTAATPVPVEGGKSSNEPEQSSNQVATKAADAKVHDGKKPDLMKVEITPLVSEAPPPKENIWDKRKQEFTMRETPSPPTNVQGTEAEVSAVKDAESTTKDTETGDGKMHGRREEQSSRRGRGRTRPTRDTYVAPGARARTGPHHNRQSSRNDYYQYDDSYDDGSQRYNSRGRGRSRGGFGSSSRGRHGDSRNGRRGSREDADNGPTIDQWNGPPDETARDFSAPPTSRGRGRGRGGRYSTRGGSTRGGRGRPHVILPSAASPSKRRQDSTNTDNDPQEEWETASESSDHLKDSVGLSQSNNSKPNKVSERREDTVSTGPYSRSNGSSTLRGGARASGERGRGRGERSRGRGDRGRGAYRSNREDRYNKEKSPEGKTAPTSSRGRGSKTLNGAKATGSTNGTVYKVDNFTFDDPSAVASALSNKNSELSDVSKPLSNKEKTSKSVSKETSHPVADPLDGIDLNNYAGVVIIDEMTGNKEDSDGWQDEDGFQEVVSRKTRKEKQRQEEAAAKAAIANEQAKKKQEKKKAVSLRSTSPLRGARKNKLPPRFRKQHFEEEKPKVENFKIDQWETNTSAPAVSRACVGEPPVQIGSWDQRMATVAAVSDPITTTSTSTIVSSSSSQPITTSAIVGDNNLLVGQPTPADKSGEQHDSGIDVGNEKDTSSVRSSPDAGSLPMRQPLVSSQLSPFSSVLPPPQHESGKPSSRGHAPSLSSAAPVGVELDFKFDPTLAEQHNNNSASVDLDHLRSMKSIWGQNSEEPASNQANNIFGSNQPSESAAYQSTEVYEQVDIAAAVDAFQSSTDGFSATAEGFRTDGFTDATSYMPSNSQSNNLFVSPTGKDQSNAAVIGGAMQQPSPSASALRSPQSAGNGNGAGGVATTASSSSHSVLDGSASAFTPSYRYKAGERSSVSALPGSQSAHSYTSFMNPMANQPGQSSQAGQDYPVYRSQSVPQSGLSQGGQQGSLTPGLQQQQAIFSQHQPSFQPNVAAVNSQAFQPALLVGTSSVTSPLMKQTTATAFSQPKLGQFDSSSNTTTPQPHQSMPYPQAYEMQGIIGGQPTYRIASAPTPAQLTQPPSSYFTPQSNMNFYGTSTNGLHASSGGSNYTIGHNQLPATLMPNTGIVLGVTPNSGWSQQTSQPQMKAYKATGASAVQLAAGVQVPGLANQMKGQQQLVVSQQAVAAATRTSQPNFQLTAGGNTFTSGQQAASAAEYVGTQQHNLSNNQAKWVGAGNQPQEKTLMAGAGPVLTASQIPPSSKMPGASMIPAPNAIPQQIQQIQKAGNSKGGYPGGQVPGPRQAFSSPRCNINPNPQILGVMGQQQAHRHASNQSRVPYPGNTGMARPNVAHTGARFPAPIQRPASLCRPTNRSSKTPPTPGTVNPKGTGAVGKSGPSGESKYVSVEQRNQERMNTINMTKNFCNPGKPNPSKPPAESESPNASPAAGDQASPPAAPPSSPPATSQAAESESASAPAVSKDEQ